MRAGAVHAAPILEMSVSDKELYHEVRISAKAF